MAEILSSSEHGPAPPSITGVICEESGDVGLVFCPKALGLITRAHVSPRVRRRFIARDPDRFIGKMRRLSLVSLKNFLSKRRK